jgi:hypothetical protein
MESDSNSISLHGFCFVAFGLTSVYYQLTVMTCCCCIISSSVVESLTTSRVQSCWVFWSYPFFSSELLLIIWLLAFWKIFLFGFGWALLLIFGDCTSFRWNGGGLVWGAKGEYTPVHNQRGGAWQPFLPSVKFLKFLNENSMIFWLKISKFWFQKQEKSVTFLYMVQVVAKNTRVYLIISFHILLVAKFG